ncbi:MAG TPA: hypothetical protein VNW04_16090 [Puia sp.]|nr:hypothetical protein [Puia sp.]
MSPKLALAFLLAASATLAKGQNNNTDSIRDSYHIFFPAMGKDILAAHIGAHSYKIVNTYDQPSEVYVDDKKITGEELAKYDGIIQRIKTSVRDDDEDRQMREMARDRRQAERDQQQAARDREQAARDREQAQRDRGQQQIEHAEQRREHVEQQHERAQQQREQKIDRAEQQHEQTEQQRERAEQQHERAQQQREQQIDRAEQQRERAEQQREREEANRDRIQANFDRPVSYQERTTGNCNCTTDGGRDEADIAQHREQSAEDRAMLKKGIQVLVDEHIIDNTQHLKTLMLSDTDLSVNGVKQPTNIYQQVRTKLGDWAHNGFSYDSAGPADNYSLSIND